MTFMRKVELKMLTWVILRASRDHEIDDVAACHAKFGILRFEVPGHLSAEKLKERIDFMQEELNEFKEAASTQDMEKMLDALIDLTYVAKGTAVMMGLRRAWRTSWAEVQRANMAKVRGVTHRGHAVDLMKPAGWVPPDHGVVLKLFGYVRARWFDGSEFMEERARGDERCGTTGCRRFCDATGVCVDDDPLVEHARLGVGGAA